VADDATRLRVDRWLFFARFFKTRTLAAEMVAAGRLRLNGARIGKPAHAVGPGDVLTFPQGGRIRVVRVLAPAPRRGPPAEAQALYLDLEAQDAGPPPAPPEERPD
jgi:ribosome-associated heat shock protein Hsp15